MQHWHPCFDWLALSKEEREEIRRSNNLFCVHVAPGAEAECVARMSSSRAPRNVKVQSTTGLVLEACKGEHPVTIAKHF